LIKLLNALINLVNNMFEILLYGGIALIILGAILYGVSYFMVKYYESQINKHTFEILRPKIKRKK
jgi:uncharacterized protein (UPF0264 family)